MDTSGVAQAYVDGIKSDNPLALLGVVQAAGMNPEGIEEVDITAFLLSQKVTTGLKRDGFAKYVKRDIVGIEKINAKKGNTRDYVFEGD